MSIKSKTIEILQLLLIKSFLSILFYFLRFFFIYLFLCLTIESNWNPSNYFDIEIKWSKNIICQLIATKVISIESKHFLLNHQIESINRNERTTTGCKCRVRSNIDFHRCVCQQSKSQLLSSSKWWFLSVDFRTFFFFCFVEWKRKPLYCHDNGQHSLPITTDT